MSLPILEYRQWAKIFRAGGALYRGRDGLGHHIWAYAPSGKDTAVLVAVAAHSDGADVLPVYIKNMRKAWQLRVKDGVSDRDFLKGEWT